MPGSQGVPPAVAALLGTVEPSEVLAIGLVDAPPGADRLPLDRESARAQPARRHRLVVVDVRGWEALEPDDRRMLVHTCAQQLVPGGRLVTIGPIGELAALCADNELRLVAHDGDTGTWARPDRRTIHDLLADARAGLVRLSAAELHARLGGDDRPVVLDVRPSDVRARTGVIAGSVHAPRTTLEWLADPASGYSHPAVTSFDQQLVVVCDEGYSSSLAAATLRELGFGRATDLIGGMRAWTSGGFPVEPAG